MPALDPSIAAFCTRKSEYGVHFCVSDTLKDMRKADLHVEVLDFSAAAAAGTKSMDDFYLQVSDCWSCNCEGFNYHFR